MSPDIRRKPRIYRRRWVWLVLAVIVLAIGLVAVRLSDVVRVVAVAKLRLATGRPVSIAALTVDPFTGRISMRGFRLADHDGSVLGDIEQLDARIHLRSLLRGRVWIHDLVIVNSNVRVVRLNNGDFNLSDLIPKGDGKPSGGGYDVTVDHFALRGGTVALEDRALTPPRTWHSRDITIEARDLSTRGRGGVADGSTLLEGAPVTVRLDDLQLAPVHFRGRLTTKAMDLGLVRLYVPANAPLTLDRGHLDTTVDVVHDAHDGTRVDVNARATDVAAIRKYERDPTVVAPVLAIVVRDFHVAVDGAITLAHVEATGHGSIVDADVTPAARFDLDRVHLAAADVTWPVKRPSRVALAATLKTGGELRVNGTARTGPSAADLDVKLTGLKLEPWARYVPGPTRVTGVADAAFSVQADLGSTLAARARGNAGVQRLVMTQGDQRLVSAERAEALGIDVQWPSRITIERVRLRRPTAAAERDAAGEIDLVGIFTARGAVLQQAPEIAATPDTRWNGEIQVGQVVVEGGAFSWGDAAVTPATRFTVTGIDARVGDITWPRLGVLPVSVRAATPRGGRVEVAGRVGTDPISADVHVVAKGVELAPYAGYVPITGRVVGRADLDLAVVVPPRTAQAPIVARGSAGLARATVFDGVRSMVVVERADAVGLDVEWPSRVTVERVALTRPWAVVERDAKGGFPLRALLAPRPAESGGETATAEAASGPTVTVGRLTVDGGGVRYLDHTVSPTYVEEVTRLSVRATGFGTANEEPGRVDLTARLGPRGTLAVRGAVRASPLLVDLQGDLREVGVPSLNSWVESFTGWRAQNGRLSTKMTYRVHDDRLEARNEIALSRLEVIRAAAKDEAQQRVGLPLGLLVSLMTDSRGDIKLAVPIGGTLSDPRFELRELIWAALRRISVKAVTLPVSWIGRVRVGKDARIQEVDVDPVAFEPGRGVLTAAGDAQLGRLGAFMLRLPETKMAVTPVVSLGDIDELKRDEVRRAIARRAAADGLPPEQAAARVFAEQLPRMRPPATVEGIVSALARDAEPPDAAAVRLAKDRVELVKTGLKKSGVDVARLEIHTDAEAVETGGGGSVELGLVEQVRQKKGRLAELLAKLREVFQTAFQRGSHDHPAASPRLLPGK